MQKKYWKYPLVALVVIAAIGLPTLGYCDVDGTLDAIQNKLTSKILPAVGMLGLMFSGLSFFIGSPNARSHLVMGIVGALVGFGAPSLIHLIQSLVR